MGAMTSTEIGPAHTMLTDTQITARQIAAHQLGITRQMCP
jgi:hypothetical protein